MSTASDAIRTITAVLNDPDVDLEFEDREVLYDATGLLFDYVPNGELD